MDQVHSTSEQYVKGKHLTYDERMIIQIRHNEGCSPNRIAAEIGCASNKEATSVMDAFEQIRMEYSEHFSEVFKTITTDRQLYRRGDLEYGGLVQQPAEEDPWIQNFG